MNHAYVCDGIRTPIGRFGHGLTRVRADALAAIPIRAKPILTAMRALVACDARPALVTMCVGVGQGLSPAIEQV